jgi:hypothetical protein
MSSLAGSGSPGRVTNTRTDGRTENSQNATIAAKTRGLVLLELFMVRP